MKKVLVTGSSGYLGKNFIENTKGRFEITTFSLLKNKLSEIDFSNVDTVLHTAGLVHQKKELSYDHYYDVNVKYTFELAKFAKKAGVKFFVFISSISVYGENVESIDGNTACLPATNYGKSKLEAEQKLISLEDNDFKVAIIRPPMVYGKDCPGNMNSLLEMIKKVPIIPLGGIKNKRSFVFIGNLTAFISMLIEKQKSGVYLVSDDEPISTSLLIKQISKAMNKFNLIIYIPLMGVLLKWIKPSFYNKLYKNLIVDHSESYNELNFKNPYSINQGIQRMVE